MANSESCQEQCNQIIVEDLYKALNSKDTNALERLLAPDLEWWFHGPPRHRHHLIRFLTGCCSSAAAAANDSVVLVPDLIVGFGSVVVAEGYDAANFVWWVHAWTVAADGRITLVREYLNTSVTVIGASVPSQTASSSVAAVVASNSKCQSIWQSKLSDGSVPGLILAI